MLDLRVWLTNVNALGELVCIDGANWWEDIGAVTELAQREQYGPAVLFDRIPGYPAGHRVLTNSTGSVNRLALALGMKPPIDERTFIVAWRERLKQLRPIAPRIVSTGPVMEHTLIGEDIDLLRFPTPQWHPEDGGRYIGTGDAVITRDADSNSVNLGTYRVMVAGRDRLVAWIIPGKDGYLHRESFFRQGSPCPVVISFGHHPAIFLVAGNQVPHGMNEYEYLGSIIGEPVEVIRGPVTGLPIPAAAEFAVEGEFLPDETLPDGPFGEWTGYYCSSPRPEPVIKVQAIHYREDPIILGSPPCKPPMEVIWSQRLLRAMSVEDSLYRIGVPQVQGVWYHAIGGCRFLMVISIKPSFPGHARQAAFAALGSKTGAFMGRFVIVVDEHVPIDDLEAVLDACLEADPHAYQIITGCWSSNMDPAIIVGDRMHNSRLIIDATKGR